MRISFNCGPNLNDWLEKPMHPCSTSQHSTLYRPQTTRSFCSFAGPQRSWDYLQKSDTPRMRDLFLLDRHVGTPHQGWHSGMPVDDW
jgi:hypothetical protein